MADHGDWTTDDFCTECKEFASKYMVKRRQLPTFISMSLNFEDSSACSLCRFWYATLHPGGTSSKNLSNGVFHVIWAGYTPTASLIEARDLTLWKRLRGAFVLLTLRTGSSTTEQHFVLPLLPRGDRAWPGTKSARDPMYRGAGDKWNWPLHSLKLDSIDMKILSQWMTGCQTKHVKRCPDITSESRLSIRSLPGFKLLDCTSRHVVQAPEGCEYVALSYVWGQPSTHVTDNPVSDENAAGILPTMLPNTVEDSMIITLKLGFRYLWVDKYCINQGAHVSELQEQLTAMDVIYHCAVVTIIAAAGEDAYFGLPGVGSRPRMARQRITVDGTTWVSGLRDTHKPMQLSRWATRGWTYQEDHFACRRLIFTNEQVLFECNTCRRNESMNFEMSEEEDQSSDIFGLSHGQPRSALKLYEHIQNYTLSTLTYQSDVLNALRGLFASFMRDRIPIKQFWGIPTIITAFVTSLEPTSDNPAFDYRSLGGAFAFGLTWTVTTDSTSIRRTGYPSWSWAGWITPVSWPTDGPLDFDEVTSTRFSLIDRHGKILPLTDDLIDQVFAGSNDISPYTYLLHITAEMLQVTFVDLKTLKDGVQDLLKFTLPDPSPAWDEKRNRYAAMRASASDERDLYWFMRLTPDFEEDNELRAALCTEVFKCIVLSSNHGIVVRKRAGVMERIGRLDLLACTDVYEGWLEVNPPRAMRPHIRDFYPGKVDEIVLG